MADEDEDEDEDEGTIRSTGADSIEAARGGRPGAVKRKVCVAQKPGRCNSDRWAGAGRQISAREKSGWAETIIFYSLEKQDKTQNI